MKYIIILSVIYLLNCFNSSSAQVFNKDAIPLTTGAYIQSSNTPYTGSTLNMKTGNIQLVIDSQGLKLLYNGIAVWNPYKFTTNPTNPTILFKSDGNFCIRESSSSTVSSWCNNYYGIGAKYLNILPEGSYGRQWAIVTQDQNGQMVWGRFGPAISTKGILPLIPGNYIDSKLSTNKELTSSGRKCINNGKDYLCVNSRSSDALSFYAPLIQSNFNSEPQWKVSNPVSGREHKVIFGSDSNFCVTQMSYTPLWCNGYIYSKQRYLVVPIASDYDNYQHHAAWVTLDDDMNMVSGRVINLQQQVNRGETFPSSGISNDFMSIKFDLSTGALRYYSKLENNKLIKTSLPKDTSSGGSYAGSFVLNSGFHFYKKPTWSYSNCNFMNQQCYSWIEKFEKTRIQGAQSYWDSKKPSHWFGLSRYLPDVVVLDSDGMIISTSKLFNKAHYQ